MLAQHDGAWYYREKLGQGHFSAQRPLGSIPALAAVGHAEQH